MTITVIDGQGAGLGQAIIKKLKKEIPSAFIAALGTNPSAAENMKKAGADTSIYGEQMIVDFFISENPECIIGPIGILCSGGINGEITSKIAEAIFKIKCSKYILPLKNHGLYIPGTRNLDIKSIIEEIIFDIKSNNFNK